MAPPLLLLALLDYQAYNIFAGCRDNNSRNISP